MTRNDDETIVHGPGSCIRATICIQTPDPRPLPSPSHSSPARHRPGVAARRGGSLKLKDGNDNS